MSGRVRRLRRLHASERGGEDGNPASPPARPPERACVGETRARARRAAAAHIHTHSRTLCNLDVPMIFFCCFSSAPFAAATSTLRKHIKNIKMTPQQRAVACVDLTFAEYKCANCASRKEGLMRCPCGLVHAQSLATSAVVKEPL